eukprot:PRCOL_00002872-RA
MAWHCDPCRRWRLARSRGAGALRRHAQPLRRQSSRNRARLDLALASYPPNTANKASAKHRSQLWRDSKRSPSLAPRDGPRRCGGATARARVRALGGARGRPRGREARALARQRALHGGCRDARRHERRRSLRRRHRQLRLPGRFLRPALRRRLCIHARGCREPRR